MHAIALSAPQPYTIARDLDFSSQATSDIDLSREAAGTTGFPAQISEPVYGLQVGDRNTQINNYFGSASSGRLLVDKIDDDEWLIRVELPAIQAGRTVLSVDTFWIVAEQTCRPSFDATIYSSDTTPFASHVDLEIQVDELAMPYREIVDQFLMHHPLPD